MRSDASTSEQASEVVTELSGTVSTVRSSDEALCIWSTMTEPPPARAATAPTPKAPKRKWRLVSSTSPPFGVGMWKPPPDPPKPPPGPFEPPAALGLRAPAARCVPPTLVDPRPLGPSAVPPVGRRCAPLGRGPLEPPKPATLPTLGASPLRPPPDAAPPSPATFPT